MGERRDSPKQVPQKNTKRWKTAKLPEVAQAGDTQSTPQALLRLHRGDIMSPEKRSALMSRIRGKNTGPERAVVAIVGALGLKAEFHARDLPGRPDLVLRALRVAIFVDGDFWHGWRFPLWRRKLSEKWELKIAANRRRDVLNHARLRRAGWLVIRIWEHQIEREPKRVTAKLRKLLARRTAYP
jgi:DNA mismatch endonuclease, patch repair protein